MPGVTETLGSGRLNSAHFLEWLRSGSVLHQKSPLQIKGPGKTVLSLMPSREITEPVAAAEFTFEVKMMYMINVAGKSFLLRSMAGDPLANIDYAIADPQNRQRLKGLWFNIPVIIGSQSGDVYRLRQSLGDDFPPIAFAVTYLGKGRIRVESLCELPVIIEIS